MENFLEEVVFASLWLALKVVLFTILVGGPIAWFVAGLRLVSEKEQAVKIVFSQPKSVCRSGLRWLWWFFGLNRLVRYPSTFYEYRIPITVTTAQGNYDPPGAALPIVCKLTKSKISVVVYLKFAERPEFLVNADTGEVVMKRKGGKITNRALLIGSKSIPESARVRLLAGETLSVRGVGRIMIESHPLLLATSKGVSTIKDGPGSLKDQVEESVTAAARTAMAPVTWAQLNFNREKVAEVIRQELTEPCSVFSQYGFRPHCLIKFELDDVELPPSIQDALNAAASAVDQVAAESDTIEDALTKMVEKRLAARATKLNFADMDAYRTSMVPAEFAVLYDRVEGECRRDLADQRSRKAGALKDIKVAGLDGLIEALAGILGKKGP